MRFTMDQMTSIMEIMKQSIAILQAKSEKLNDKEALALLINIQRGVKHLEEQIRQYKNQVDNLSAELSKARIPHPNELTGTDSYSHIKKYRALRNQGCDAKTLNYIAMLDGVIPGLRATILNELYDLSSQEIQQMIE